MVNTALQEAEIEGLVIAKGFEDCVTYMSDGAISVAVAAPEEGLSTESVAQICDIVVTQSDYSPSQLKIIEVR
jgi:stage III sporulation protein AH